MARIRWAEDLETGILMIHARDKWCFPALEAFMHMARSFFNGVFDDSGHGIGPSSMISHQKGAILINVVITFSSNLQFETTT